MNNNQRKGKTVRRILFVVVIGLLINAQLSFATIVNLTDIDGVYDGFYDDQTGSTWLDIDTYTSMSFNQVEAKLQGTAYHIATYEELITLHDHLWAQGPVLGTSDSFDYWTNIMGVTDFLGTPHLWGIYDNGIEGEYASAWTTAIDEQWYYDDSTDDLGYKDRDSFWEGQGAWILTNPSSPVPEPSTLLLLGSALLGLVTYRNKFKKA